MTLSSILVLAFPALMLVAAVSDLATMTISNKVPLFLVGVFAILGVLLGMAPTTAALHGLVGLGVLAVTFGCFAMGWMGGGDAKLMAATALWFGPTTELTSYLLNGAIFGGVLTLGLLIVRSRLAPVTGIGFVDRLLHPKTGIPYGIALGLAGLVVFADSAWIDLASAG